MRTDGRTDRQTDRQRHMTKLRGAFRNFAKAPKEGEQVTMWKNAPSPNLHILQKFTNNYYKFALKS